MANRLALLGILRAYVVPKILRSISYGRAVKMSVTCKSLYTCVRAAVKERAAAFEAKPFEFVEAGPLEAEEIVEYLRHMDKDNMAFIMFEVTLDLHGDAKIYTAVIKTMIKVDVSLAAAAVHSLPEDLDRMVFWDLCKQEQLDLIAAMDDTELVACWLEVLEEDEQDQHSEVFRLLPVAIGAEILSHIDATSAGQMLLSCSRPQREEYFHHMKVDTIASIFEAFEQLVDDDPEYCWEEFFCLLPVTLSAAVLQHCRVLPTSTFIHCRDAGYLVDLLCAVDAPIAAEFILDDVDDARRGTEDNSEQGRQAFHRWMRLDVPLLFRQAGPEKAAGILQALDDLPLAAQFLERMRDGARIADILWRLEVPIASSLLDIMQDVGVMRDVIGALGEEQAGRLVACSLQTRGRGLPAVLFLMHPRVAAGVLGAMLPDEALRLSIAYEPTKPWLRILNAMDWHCLMCLLKCMGAQKACSILSKLDAKAGARLLSGVELADAVWMVSAVSDASLHTCAEAWGLASILSLMTPALAGRILSGTRDSEHVAGLCCKMRPGASAAILSSMDNAVFARSVRMRM